MNSYRVLVTGSREWDDRDQLERVLNTVLSRNCPLVIIHGKNPRGADAMAADWVNVVREGFEVTAEPYPADWARLHKAAGNARNQVMVDAGADVCYAFYKNDAGNRGTADCVARAEAAGIPVRRFRG